MLARPVVLYDGECPLCRWSVRFAALRDRRGAFAFAALQSAAGARLLTAHGLPAGKRDTVVLVDGARALERSDAVLAVFRELPWPWRALWWKRWVPRRWRDAVYDWVAANRSWLWRGPDQVPLPPPGREDRFLDEIPG